MRKLSMDELNRLSAEEFRAIEKLPYILILDDIRSMNNVGSVFRTADAFKAEKIYLCGITATPPHREIQKTALGADETVDWEHAPDVVALIAKLQAEGYTVIAIEQVEGSTSLLDFQPKKTEKYAFIFGNEVFGVNETAVKNANYCLEIPQYGTKHSLNISVTAGIICWHYVAGIQ
ncbi:MULTISPECIES: RNA methyltransferase [Bacteroidota]|uniref:RNA methyltransferase n=1 Tax=Flectobacillus rivi TaxID=2984209 RepID=A0ABT6YY06_9BACT|nr:MULTISPECIES: RNA methyltransferase [Bacteroidota]MDI9873655.1 RNA methyltransferase [Flectobacillus rivi]NBB29207.1 TrmH family RNA methyltransferase [Cellulophaga sp. BC115SP]